MTDDTEVRFVAPDRPPELGPVGWRALLRILTNAAEEEWGENWRQTLRDRTS